MTDRVLCSVCGIKPPKNCNNGKHHLCVPCIDILMELLKTKSPKQVAAEAGFPYQTAYYYKYQVLPEHRYSKPEKSKLGNIERHTLAGFIKYFTARPEHFKELYGAAPDKGNIEAAFKEINKLRLNIKFGDPSNYASPDLPDDYAIYGMSRANHREGGE